MTTINAIRGMLAGAFLGDALGAPHEFYCNRGLLYTGKLQYRPFMISQFQGRKELEIGQITDDSEMTLALLRTVLKDRGFNLNNIILSYLRWANSGGWMMGKNTRALLKGVTTVKGYNDRMKTIYGLPQEQRSQSNGAMMRCSPLALLWDNNCVMADVNITNPNSVCLDCNLVYVSALRLALLGKTGSEIFNTVKTLAQTTAVKDVMLQVEKREHRNIAENKGWCLHALWCAMMTITTFTDYKLAMNWIIASQPGSDTDTNACISGALLGAVIGYSEIEQSERDNLAILFGVDTSKGPTPRPLEYGITDFVFLSNSAYELVQSQFPKFS
jgi:ADP-ribosyl-[dinitrogen reductase] hydrolase